MFKKLFKTRHDATSKRESAAPQPSSYAYGWNSRQIDSYGSAVPVEYDREGPVFAPISQDSSTNPVEYSQSPLYGFVAGASDAPDESSTTSLIPVDYRASAPAPVQRQVAQPKVVVDSSRYSQSPSRYMYAGDATPPLSPAQPHEFSPGPNAEFAYYAPRAEAINVRQTLIELPASPVQRPYELPDSRVLRQTPVPPYSSPYQSPNSGWDSPQKSSTTTLIPSPRSVLSSPTLSNTKGDSFPSPNRSEQDGIKKFVIDIYCPLKKDASGNRREQIPRDVREFRLAKVALIPIVAGKRTFVSFDVVFGEMDKAYSQLVEKHFSFSHQTKFTKLSLDAVIGAQVYTIGPLNIAYRDGDRSIVYMKFPSPEDKDRFKADFWDMWQYVEQTAG